ncbi:hypothetical protein RND71_001749 [Anisodus tanguticus]|uniref:Uncharacterized protein n=1 Tax=Anisodus tanguticus TaxID=243964 RepID=A0AAE1T1H0_9SOLA|nr:hypothetical protein RND71_001749 [Anisodus tanguticus]
MLTELERRKILKDQKVLLGRVFDFDIADKFGIKKLLDIIEFQKWTHFFVSLAPSVFEEEENSIIEIQRLHAENAILRAQLVEKAHEPGTSGVVEVANAENVKLKVENKKLKHKIDKLRDQMSIIEEISQIPGQAQSKVTHYYSEANQAPSPPPYGCLEGIKSHPSFKRIWLELNCLKSENINALYQSSRIHTYEYVVAMGMTLESFRNLKINFKLTIDLGQRFLWVDCEKRYVSSSYKSVLCGSVTCKRSLSGECVESCLDPPPTSIYNALTNAFIKSLNPWLLIKCVIKERV